LLDFFNINIHVNYNLYIDKEDISMVIDIIIPAYNSHKTIVNTLRSIAIQTVASKIKVTIVNDGGDGYKDIISLFPDLAIEEIKIDNGGPAIARQIGIERTSLPYIVFIDSDDILLNAFSILDLFSQIKKSEDIVCVNSRFVNETEDGRFEIMNDKEFVWLFGNIYRRSFILNNNVSFPKFSANEDLLFNLQIEMIAEQQKKSIVYLERATYLWNYNKNSITRRNGSEYAYFDSTYHIIVGKHEIFKRFPRSVTSAYILKSIWDFFYFWEQSILNRAQRPDYHNNLMKAIRDFYQEYKDVLNMVSDDEWRKVGDVKRVATNYFSKYNFNDFINMMKHKDNKK
jgi:glycosyltransferase involved in cell wall biosynthesis